MKKIDLKKNKRKKSFYLFLVVCAQIILIAFFINQIDFLKQLNLDLITKSLLPSYKIKLSEHQKYLKNSDPVVYAKSLPVLVYHGVISKGDASNIIIDDFRNQMVYLKSKGYETITLEDLYGFLKNGKELPEKSFLLTFDDGRKDSYYPVDPILDALGYKAVMFIISNHSLFESSRYYLNKVELSKMLVSGRWEIQAHSKNGHDLFNINEQNEKGYFYSNKLWLSEKNRLETHDEYIQRITTDLGGVKKDIQDVLKTKVTSFAYPFGDYGQVQKNNPSAIDDIAKVMNKNFKMSFVQLKQNEVFSQNYFNAEKESTGSAVVKRIEIGPDWNQEDLLTKMEIGVSKQLPFEDDFKSNKGWVKTRGDLYHENDSLFIASTVDRSGGSTFLDGTLAWTDYLFSAFVDLKKGESVSLISRYRDGNNYISCNFTSKYTSIRQRVEGKDIKLAESKNSSKTRTRISLLNMNELSLKMAVNKDRVGCSINGTEIISAKKVSNTLLTGGIGFQTWDKTLNNSEVVIKNVNVSTN
ncbi:MAG: polysaccharide deacetylase family protein [Patescibacteria group bacterium]